MSSIQPILNLTPGNGLPIQFAGDFEYSFADEQVGPRQADEHGIAIVQRCPGLPRSGNVFKIALLNRGRLFS